MTNHPANEDLVAFGLGKLDEPEAQQVAEHLDECRDCSETILHLKDDTFLSLVRKSPAPAAPEEAASPSEVHSATDATVDSASGAVGDTGKLVDLPEELRRHPRYEILEAIGRGGMGDVYKAQHKVMNRVVALKVIKPELVRNESAIGRFRREVRAAARLRHGNIVTAHDAEQAGNLHFLVMEFVDGVSLDEVIRTHGRLAVADACNYIRQAAEGLQHAHDLGMVHRDIKPHNLMIERQTGTIIGSADVVKILDFGLANFANEVAAEELNAGDTSAALEDAESMPPGASIVRQLTQMGTMMGTPDYMAPEQAENAHAADIRADIYSLGCTFYTLLTGKAPFSEGSVVEKIKAHSQRDAAPVSQFRDDVPEQVEAVLRKMMAKNPADRYQTPVEVAAALASVSLANRGLADITTQALEPAVRSTVERPRSRVAALTAVALLFVAAIVAGVVFYIQTDYGVVRVEVADESLAVTLNGRTITAKDGQTPLSIRTGQQQLVVKRGEFKFETSAFQIRRGDEIVLKVELLPGEVVVSKNGQRFGAKALPSIEPSGPAERIVVALKKDGSILVNDRPVGPREMVTRVQWALGENHDREVFILPDDGLTFARLTETLTALRHDRLVGARNVQWPQWFKAFQYAELGNRREKLRRIGIALRKYHDERGHFPPAPGTAKHFDDEGRPYLSWRVHLLPYLGEEELYKQFHLDEPWDSAHNKPLLARIPDVYKTKLVASAEAAEDSTSTTMLAVVGKGTAYEGKTGLNRNDFKDGLNTTAYIVNGGPDGAVPWTKPADRPFHPEYPMRAFVDLEFPEGYPALMADGSTTMIPRSDDFNDTTLRVLLTRDAGDLLDRPKSVQLAKAAPGDDSSSQPGKDLALVAALQGHTGAIMDLAYSRDGKWIASAGNDFTVHVCDAQTHKIVASFVHREKVAAVAFSPDSRWLITGTVDAEITLRELVDKGGATTTFGKQLLRLHDLAFSPDGEYILCCGAGVGDKRTFAALRNDGKKGASLAKSIQYEDTTPLRKLAVWPGVPGFVTAVSDRGEAVTWNYLEGKGRDQDNHAPANLDYKTGVAIGLLGDGHRQIIGNAAGELWFRDDRGAEKERRIELPMSTYCLAVLPGDKYVIVGGSEGNSTTSIASALALVEIKTGKYSFLPEAKEHKGVIRAIAISPDGRRLVTSAGWQYSPVRWLQTNDFAICIWRLPESVWPTETKTGWVPLFNGRDLTGWSINPDNAGNWRVEKGVLIGGRLDDGGEDGNSFLQTARKDFTNFHLRLEAKLNPGAADAGVLFDFAQGTWAEVNMSFDPNTRDRYTGSIMVKGTSPNGRTWQSAPTDLASPGEWFTVEVIAVDRQLTTKVNGKVAAVHTQRNKTTGAILLQDHGPFTVVEIRKIEIMELDGNGLPISGQRDTSER